MSESSLEISDNYSLQTTVLAQGGGQETQEVNIKRMWTAGDVYLDSLLASMSLSRGAVSEEDSCSLTLAMSFGWR